MDRRSRSIEAHPFFISKRFRSVLPDVIKKKKDLSPDARNQKRDGRICRAMRGLMVHSRNQYHRGSDPTCSRVLMLTEVREIAGSD